MENHPIPQNVTGFQFKLIGDMTVKQFAYLAAGCVFFYLFFFALPLNFLLKIPLGFGSIGLGLALAFLPIEGRPLDAMLVCFFRTLFIPNQYVYQKTGGELNVSTITIKQTTIQKKPETTLTPKKQLDVFLNRYHAQPKNSMDEKEITFLKSLSNISNPTSNPASPQKNVHHGFFGFNHIIQPHHKEPQKTDTNPKQNVAPVVTSQNQPPLNLPVTNPVPSLQNLNDFSVSPEFNDSVAAMEMLKNKKPTIAEEQREQTLENQAITLEKELEEIKLEETRQKDAKMIDEMHNKVSELEQQLKQTLLQKETLEKQIKTIATNNNVFAPSAAEPPKSQSPNIRSIPKNMGAKFGMPIVSETPNLITGIVRDSRGNILPNILVEITDKEGNPVRAFKTNTLGQFACATPLLNGTYTVLFEDPDAKHKFDGVEIVASGEIIQPLEIISIDAREELRKELFG